MVTGKFGGKGNKQSLFLIYLDAVSVSNSSKATRVPEPVAQGQAPQAAGPGMPPNMPALTMRDLEFVIKFTEVLQDSPCSHLLM